MFGVITNETGDFDNPYRYAGYYYDTETGNYYLLSRYYNPKIARFISEDTYRGELNDPLSLNRYVYVVNNPLIYTDPNGQAPIPVITGAIGGLWGFGSTLVGDLWNSAVSREWQFSSIETYLGNTIEGALTGFGLGLCGTACGGLGNFSGNAINQYINTGEVDFVKSGISGLTTLATAGAFSATGQVTSIGLNYIKDYAIRGVLAGATGDVTYQYLNNGVTKNDNKKVTGYSINQAIDSFNPVRTIKMGVTGAIMAPVGAKIVESTINKFGTLKTTRVIETNGKKVTQNDKTFDYKYIDNEGRTNIQRMKQGLAPIGIDGKSVNLHHIDQTNNGPIAEMTATYHQQNNSSLHTNTGKFPSKINRSSFDKWRSTYWKQR